MADAAARRPRGMMVLCPRRYCREGVGEISVADLQARGIDTVLLDLDNTLVPWQRREVPDDVRAWLEGLRAAGMRMCLVSNTRFGRRLQALSVELGIPFVRRAWKPRKKGFLNALSELGADPARAAMVGDQMFTDVLGGNRLGIYTVMVRPMARREFLGTKVSRLVERVMLNWFRRRGCLPEH